MFRYCLCCCLFILHILSGTTDINERLKQSITYDPSGPNTIGRIVIDDKSSLINQSTWMYVKAALDEYKKSKPCFVILELNTPGGEVYSAQKISDTLKELDTQYNIPVVCFINNWAISAGAMLAYSCRFITIVKDASMGAAEPVLMGQEGQMVTASEKINSALRADFANRAQFFNRNPLIAEAMVDKDMILVRRNGKIMKLEDEKQIHVEGSDPDEIINRKGKLLTLTAEQMMNLNVADLLLLPRKLPLITLEEEKAGRWPADKTLLFTAPFFKDIPNATVVTFIKDWKLQLFSLLSNPIISSLLFLGMIVGFYIELNTPGFGVAGTIGVSCLMLIILSSFAMEAVGWLEIIMIIVGLTLFLVDLFIIPTFGMLGIVGLGLFIIGLVFLMVPGIDSISYDADTKTLNAAGEYAFHRLAWLCGSFVASVGVIILLGRYVLPRFSPFNRFVLKGGEQDASKGYVAMHKALLPKLGEHGIAISNLRPAGKIEIAGIIHDAMSTGDFISKGDPVTVVNFDQNTVIVKLSEEKI